MRRKKIWGCIFVKKLKILILRLLFQSITFKLKIRGRKTFINHWQFIKPFVETCDVIIGRIPSQPAFSETRVKFSHSQVCFAAHPAGIPPIHILPTPNNFLNPWNVKWCTSIQRRHFFLVWNESWGSESHSLKQNWLFIWSRCCLLLSFFPAIMGRASRSWMILYVSVFNCVRVRNRDLWILFRIFQFSIVRRLARRFRKDNAIKSHSRVVSVTHLLLALDYTHTNTWSDLIRMCEGGMKLKP